MVRPTQRIVMKVIATEPASQAKHLDRCKKASTGGGLDSIPNLNQQATTRNPLKSQNITIQTERPLPLHNRVSFPQLPTHPALLTSFWRAGCLPGLAPCACCRPAAAARARPSRSSSAARGGCRYTCHPSPSWPWHSRFRPSGTQSRSPSCSEQGGVSVGWV